MSNKLSRLFRRVFLRGDQQQTGASPRVEPLPPAGRSSPNLPRGGPLVTSVEPVEGRVIEQMPTEPVPKGN